MDPSAPATIIGLVCLAIASLAHTARAVRDLFFPSAGNAAASLPQQGNGTMDVTRRELEELKQSLQQIIGKLDTIKDVLASLSQRVAVLETKDTLASLAQRLAVLESEKS